MDAPSRPPEDDVTHILAAAQQGDTAARERLAEAVYVRLRAMAGRQVRPGNENSLAATDLVHEAYIKLVDQETPWANRAHFYGVAAKAMRSILVDHARARKAQKRGGDLDRSPLHSAIKLFESKSTDLVSLDLALEELATFDADKARLVELRFFGGLTVDDAAKVLGWSVATTEREWSVARAWLRQRV